MSSTKFDKAICLFAILTALCALSTGCKKIETSGGDADGLSRLTADNSVGNLENNDATQWSSWRGGTLGGVSPAKGLPVTWSEKNNVKWKASIPGHGNSSPVVSGDRIFLTSVVAGDRGGEIALLCLHCQDGRQLWLRELGPAMGPTHKNNGHASATVATDGHCVVSYFGSQGLFCHDFQGRQKWHVPLSNVKHQWGAASSPILFGNLVIQVCDGQSKSFIAAYDKTSGRQVWRSPRTSRGCWSTPVVLQTGSQDDKHWELIVNGTSGNNGAKGFVIAYDPLSGAELWRQRGTTDIPCPTAIVGKDLIVSSSGGNGPLLALRPGRLQDDQQRVVWKHPIGGPYVPTGLIYDDRLYVVNDAGVASCYDTADGKRIWKRRLQKTFSASPIAGEGKIYAVSDQGTTYVFAASDRYESLAVNRLKERTLATPAIVQSDLLIRTEKHLYRIGKLQGTGDSESSVARADRKTADGDEVVSPSDVESPPKKVSSKTQ